MDAKFEKGRADKKRKKQENFCLTFSKKENKIPLNE